MNFLKRLFKTKTSILNSLTVTSANGFHLRPIAKFVAKAKEYDATITLEFKNKEVNATQLPQILSLALEKGDTFTLKCKGEEAKEANQALTKLFNQLMQNDKEHQVVTQEEAYYQAPSLKGKSIAKGIAIAPLVAYEVETQTENIKDISIQEAIRKTKEKLQAQYEKEKEKEESQIFLAQKELLSSALFETNFTTVEEFQRVIKKEIEKLKEGKFESRIADYLDIEQRVLQELGVTHKLKLPSFPYILVANELLPSEVEKLTKSPIKGVVLQSGTTTSHAAILLRSAAIASVIIPKKITLSKKAILDANAGELILEPTKEDLNRASIKQDAFIKRLDRSFEKRFENTTTQAGREVKILANITDPKSAKEAKGLGADGIGLLRTEFLFTHKQPTIEEQQEAYEKIFKLFSEVTVRTLDIGGDKSLPYIKIEKEDNPFLGIRGIRFSLQEQTLFKEQLLAIGLASTKTEETKVKIMFPMVSQPSEFIEAKEIALELYKEHNINIERLEFGIMLEVPSVIFALKEFDELVDFYSIGSNDLTQYLFAIERTHPTLTVETTSPILMEALRTIKESSNKPISICGELAGVEEATKSLIEMGYTTLSVSAKLIPSLKERIRNV